MKKFIKYSLIVLTLALTVTLLASCDLIDDLESHRGFWNEDGSVSYNGKIYRQLPYVDGIGINYDDYVVVTQKDVPILLSDFFGAPFSIDFEKDLLIYDTRAEFSELVTYLYCTEDKYDSLLEQIQKGPTMDQLAIKIYTYENGLSRMTSVLLTEEQRNVLSKPMQLLELPDGATIDYMNSIDIYRTSKDGFFSEFAFEIIATKSAYYISQYDEETAEWNYFVIPEKDYGVIEEIFNSTKTARVD